MKTIRPLLIRFKNSTAHLFSSSASVIRGTSTDFKCSNTESLVYRRTLRLQRPSTIKYLEILRNYARPINYSSLIGTIISPIEAFNCKKFGVHTMLQVEAPAGNSPKLWVRLYFWEEKAEMATQHLKLYDLIFVSGCLGSYTKQNEDGKLMLCHKLNVTEVNFVAQNMDSRPKLSIEDMMEKRRACHHLWQVFFANPDEWWDNRNQKLKQNAPDFKHKDTGEVLWLHDRDPPWIKKQLKLYDSRMGRQHHGTRKGRLHLSSLVYDDATMSP